MRIVSAALLVALLLGVPQAHAKDPNVAKMQSELKAAMSSRNLATGKTVIERLVSHNSTEAVEVMTGQLKVALRLGDEWYWALCKGLAAVNSKEAIDEVGEFILKYKNKPPGRDVLFYMQSNYSPYLAPMLLMLVDKGSKTIQFQALDHLGSLKQKPTVSELITRLDKESKRKTEKAYQISRTLRAITGQNFGLFVGAWRNWWLSNKDKPLPEPDMRRRTGTVADDMGGTRGGRMGRLRKGEPGEILVIGATKTEHNYDNIAGMLRSMGIPHEKVKKKDFNETDIDLTKVKAIFINCTNFRQMCICPKCTPAKGPKTNRMSACVGCDVHIHYEDKLTVDSVKKIAQWVERGGYLFTEDLGILEVLEVGFNKYVRGGPILMEQSVEVTPAIGQTGHAFLRRVFAAMLREQVPQADEGGSVEPPQFRTLDVKHKWKIDDESPTIQIVNKRAVTVLLESKPMARTHNVDPATAILVGVKGRIDLTGTEAESKMRGGRIMHVMSHFTKQSSSRDGHSLQNLMLNFLIECNERWLLKQGVKQK